jgi:cell fate regulator YaaT (PSP1 superfamily)
MAELYLVEFKGFRKEYFYNAFYHSLELFDHVVVEAERGEDIGLLTQKVDVEMDFSPTARPGSILRPASRDDKARVKELREKEKEYKDEVVNLIRKHGLPMKVVDVECQFDWNKLTVYFTADHRVDFRELVKEIAARYKTRIDLRQIGVRDEAKRLGGLGICGLKQCCSSFLKDFVPISTQHARDQDLPMNPAKLSGNCGRLLCCLRYEADTYSACLKKFPSPGSWIQTRAGEGTIERIDVFREEAIIRDQENNIFRSRAEDILTTGAREREKALAAATAVAKLDDGSLDDDEAKEALKKLDDTEEED